MQIVRAGERPRAVVYGGPWRVLHVYLPVTLLDGCFATIGLVDRPELVDPLFDVDDHMEHIGARYVRQMSSPGAFSRLQSDVQALELVMRLAQVHTGAGLPHAFKREQDTVTKGGLAPWQVRRISQYLEDHLADDVSLAELSALVGLSTYHSCRAFKRSTGLPPHRRRHQKRMERARELLEGSDLPISEVAAAVGYDDPSRLSAGFKNAFGTTPNGYRRERRS